ncbi:MAG: hypothetical protein QW279_15580 [Candidatus Jordarchaeaceae archaeon]
MKVELFDNEQIQLLKSALQVYEKQHKAIAVNVANAHDPNFQRVKTDFTEILKKAEGRGPLKVTNDRHIAGSEDSGPLDDEKGKSGVDLMEEMALLAENQIKHEAVTRFLRQKYDSLKQAISGKIF